MKRGYYIIFLFLILLIPSSSALVELGDFTKNKYNLGDKVDVDVKVELDKDFKGIFNIKLVCPEVTFPLLTKILDLTANKEVFLEESVAIPIGASGGCTILAELKDEESDESKVFTITKELIGNFKVDKSEIQLGQKVKLTGQVLRLSQTNVDGVATLFIKRGEEVILVQPVDVKNGELTYTYKAENAPQGSYTINIDVLDIFGNEMLFENAARFDVTGIIEVNVESNKVDVFPGESIELTGSVKYKKLSGVSPITLSVNEENILPNEDGSFSYIYPISEKVKSGQSTLTITAKDTSGNFGEKILTYNVLPIPTTIALYLPKEEVLPGDKLDISATLFDQAGDKMAGGVNIEVYDKPGEVIASGNSKIELAIEDFSPPGIRKVKATAEDLTLEDEFSVGEKIDFEATADQTGVLLRNIGNVKFEGDVEFITGGESSFEKLSLRVDETKKISLEDRAGTYELTVLAAGKEIDLGEVTIIDERNAFSRLTSPLTGNVAGIGGNSAGVLGYLLVVIAIISFIIGFYFVKVRETSRVDLSREKDRREARLFKEGILKQREESRRRTFGREISPDEASRFREQFLGSIRKTEEEKNKFSQL